MAAAVENKIKLNLDEIVWKYTFFCKVNGLKKGKA